MATPLPSRRTALLMMAGMGLSSTAPAAAQTSAPATPPAAPASSASARPVADAERAQRPLSLGDDRTSIGGPPLTDASPRLPRVDYGGQDLTDPVAPGGGLIRGETVLGRSRPDYNPIGFNAAGFRILPEVTARAGYDSNVFSQVDGNNDVYGHLRGAVIARSDWGRHEAAFDGFIDERAYAKYTTESGITYNARATGRYDIGTQSSIDAGVQRGRIFIDRGATTEILQTRRPIRYDLTSADIGGRSRQGRFTLDVGGTYSRYDYDDSETPDGVFLSQRFRDFDLYSGRVEVGYATGAGPAVFVSATAEARRFDIVDIRIRDSNGIEILGGLRGDITPLLRGRFGAGYLHYDFKDPTLKARGGLGLDVRLDYLVTPLTTINVTARRDVRNVSSVNLPAAFALSAAAGVDHELLRNLVVSAGVNFDNANYVASPLTVKRYGAHAGGFYLANRHIRIDADLAYRRRDQSGGGGSRNFNEINASTGLTYRF